MDYVGVGLLGPGQCQEANGLILLKVSEDDDETKATVNPIYGAGGRSLSPSSRVTTYLA